MAFTLPDVEALFRDTPRPISVVTFDAYHADGLPHVALSDADLNRPVPAGPLGRPLFGALPQGGVVVGRRNRWG